MIRELRDVFYSVFPSKYLDAGLGNTNLILTAPHGGGMRPLSIPRRKYGVLLMDTYTRRVTRALLSLYNREHKPFHVISDIHRSRIDFNRNLGEGAQGNEDAEKLWHKWNELLTLYTTYCRNNYKNTLYIDIHSHNDGDYFELGYDLSAKEYLNLYHNGCTLGKTSVDTLDFDLYQMLFGEFSFKASLESFGYSTLLPKGKEVYFNGGRNIEVYSGNGIASIQIEIPVSQLKKDLNKCVDVLKYSIDVFKENFVKEK